MWRGVWWRDKLCGGVGPDVILQVSDVIHATPSLTIGCNSPKYFLHNAQMGYLIDH